MELRPGYKQTEVGVIPEDWKTSILDEVADLTSSKRIFENDYVSFGIPFYRGKEISQLIDGQEIEDVCYITEEKYAQIKARFGAPVKGDILITAVGTLANVHLVDNDTPFYFKDGNLIWLRHVKSVDQRFLSIQLRRLKTVILDGAIGSSQKALTIVVLKKLQLALPPLPEQRAIAASLSDVDSLIASLDKLIAKKRDMKQAAMQELLTGKRRLPRFSGEWEVKKLGDCGMFLKGGGVKKDEAQSGDLPCVRYGEIYTHHNDYIKFFNSWISVGVAATATRIKQGDLLFAGSGETKEEIGKCVAFVADTEAYAGGDIVILRLSDTDPTFMGYYCNTPNINAQKASKGQGDAVVHISASALSSITVCLPPFPEQTAIAAILADMDAEISALEQRRDKTRLLKQGMMQELLTGRIRLV